MEMIENRMLIDSEWITTDPIEIREKLNGKGYREIGTDIFVPDGDAYKYALERIDQDEELQKELVYWFYFNNWVRED